MRIRPARLAALLLGKRSSPPFYGLNLETALRLLRFAGAPIESQIEAIANSGGSSLWLEDFLESLEKEPATQKIMNHLISSLIEYEGRLFWQTVPDEECIIDRDMIINHLQLEVIESGYNYASDFKVIRKRNEPTVHNTFNGDGNIYGEGNNSTLSKGDQSPIANNGATQSIRGCFQINTSS